MTACDHRRGDLARRAERLAPAARLAVDADADLHLPRGQVEDRLARRRAGCTKTARRRTSARAR